MADPDPDPDARRRPDLVNRDFTASAPNELWVADFSYLRCWEALVFFSFVIDAYSRKIVDWQFASHMRTTSVLDAPRMALGTRQLVEEGWRRRAGWGERVCFAPPGRAGAP